MAYGKKLCLGCKALGHHGPSGRCAPCLLAHKAKYDADYRAFRERTQAALQAGAVLRCPRCGKPITRAHLINPGVDIGHQAGGGLAAEHSPCNRGARKAKGYALPRVSP